MRSAAIGLGAALLVCLPVASPAAAGWRTLAPGLWWGVWTAPRRSPQGDSKLRILRVDPRRYRFRLLAAKEHGRQRRTAKQWSAEFGLLAAVNAGMYREDMLTSVGYLRNYRHLNQPRLMPKYKMVWAFNPLAPGLAPAKLIDLGCGEYALLKRYASLSQSIRMLTCRGRNVWARQRQRWSNLAVASDTAGRILLVLCQSPYPVHDFINFLRRLPLGVVRAMYLEGGPQASLYVKVSGFERELWGLPEKHHPPSVATMGAWPLPNVVGVVPRPKAGKSGFKGGRRP